MSTENQHNGDESQHVQRWVAGLHAASMLCRRWKSQALALLLLLLAVGVSAPAAASTVVNATFASGTESFDAGSQVAAEGAYGTTGYLSVPTNTTATRSFTAISSGTFRTDFWIAIDDTTTRADDNANQFVYLLPTSGSVVSSNSITTIALIRNTGSSATSSLVKVSYRDSSTFVQMLDLYRDASNKYWVKISVVGDFSSKKFDLYVNDTKWLHQIGWANASASDFSRVAVVTGVNAPAIYFDELLIQDSYTLSLGETELIADDFTAKSGEIETLSPATDNRSINNQLYKIANDTSTYGAYTAGANGLTPDSSKECMAQLRCCADGILEAEWNTSVSGTAYFGLQFRTWEGPAAGGAGVLRVSGSNNTITLFLPDAGGALQNVASASLTPSANTIYTLKIEMRGRVYICSYKASARSSGSYTVALTHTVTDSASGGRGLLAEEHCGPYISTTVGATDNYCRGLWFTGKVPTNEVDLTVGGYSANLGPGTIRELYLSGSGGATKNLFWSRGIQFGHRSRADMGNGVNSLTTLYNGTDCKSYSQYGGNLTEYEYVGEARPSITFLRRGIWVADRQYPAGASENLAPDCDFRGELFSASYKALGATGTSVSDLSDSSFSSWRVDIDNSALPLCFQRVTAFGAGSQVRFTSVIRNNQNWTATGESNDLAHKYLGNTDPISLATVRHPTEVVGGTIYECARAYLLQVGSLSLDNTTLIDFRDDVKTPAAISTFATGSLKTDAAGDIDTDGFNERYGWYEINCSGGTASFTFPVSSGTRFMPAFRLHSWTNTNTDVTIAGTPGVEGTDYVIDDMGGNVAVLQLLSNRTGNTTIALSTPEGGGPNAGVLHFYQMMNEQ